ncbi:MAG: isocitrate lyase/phosphoenolpyruvate mutase family protein, partial [Polaromonas sp.]|nr:isocitrate lyase/phosphoenolpyruvate mutase family protein [Polaromonas sp.]
GYGGVVGVRRCIEEFEAAGVAGIHIEDQTSPKRCAQLPGAREVLPFKSAVAKIEAAVAACTDPSFLVIGRTDSAASCGVAEAIARAQAFERAGAAAVFVELKGHAGILDDIRRVADAVTIPCMVNIDAGGPLAGLHAHALHTHGIALAIYPSLIRSAVGFAMRSALQHLQQDGSTTAVRTSMLSSKEYNDTLGLPEVEQWELSFPE